MKNDEIHFSEYKKGLCVCGRDCKKDGGNWTTSPMTFWSWRPRCPECEEIIHAKDLQPSLSKGSLPTIQRGRQGGKEE